jgi:hypothetical protein
MRSFRFILPFAMICLGLVLSCSEDDHVTQHVVTPPDSLSGPTITEVDTTTAYETGGAVSSKGDRLEYRFDWGDSTYSEWSVFPRASHSWDKALTYEVRASARSAEDTNTVSKWSRDVLEVTVVDTETVTRPAVPSGQASLCSGDSRDFTTGGAACSKSHAVEYRFDWGDSTYSNWSPLTMSTHAWTYKGGYNVRAQARCAVNKDKVSGWSQALTVTVTDEGVTPPTKPIGPSGLCLGETGNYDTGGAESSCGHDVEYRFSWGDGSESPWSPSTSASHAWTNPGPYEVKSQARCRVHTNVVSDWSMALNVTVVEETISAPERPIGPSSVCPDEPKTFSTGGAKSSCDHDVEYQFDWGDGTYSGWSTSPTSNHAWSVKGVYEVRARARCIIHPDKISPWSPALVVTVSDETVSVTDAPSGPPSLCPDEEATYIVDDGGSSCGHSLEYEFDWGNGETSGWSTSKSAKYSWPEPDAYEVTVRARCATHTGVVSNPSPGLSVSVAEIITPPQVPTGPDEVCAGESESYQTGGASSSCSHAIEYRFAWGDGDFSDWSDTPVASHAWASGVYQVVAQVRCKEHTSVMVESASLEVSVGSQEVWLEITWDQSGRTYFSGNYPASHHPVWQTEEVQYDDPDWSRCSGDAAIFNPYRQQPAYRDAVGRLYETGQNGIYVHPATDRISVTIQAGFESRAADEQYLEVAVGTGCGKQGIEGDKRCDTYTRSFDRSCFPGLDYVPLELRVPAGPSVDYREVAVSSIKIRFIGWCRR